MIVVENPVEIQQITVVDQFEELEGNKWRFQNLSKTKS